MIPGQVQAISAPPQVTLDHVTLNSVKESSFCSERKSEIVSMRSLVSAAISKRVRGGGRKVELECPRSTEHRYMQLTCRRKEAAV